MPRNASGTYTLPSGNPVVSGNIIEASWANNTLNDLATEMTNSLSRTGAGGMTGALRLADGTASVPALAWGAETGTGFYRAGASDTRFVVSTNLVQKWTAAGTEVTGNLSATGTLSAGALSISGATTFTSDLTVGAGGTGNTDAIVYINGGSDTSGEAILALRRNSVSEFLLTAADSLLELRGVSNKPLAFRTNDTEWMRLGTTGLVGIGGTASTYKLEVISGDASFNGVRVGRGAGAVATNTSVGASALAANTTGLQNVATGASALSSNTTGQQSTAVGFEALKSNTTGSNHTAFGSVALTANTTGTDNTAYGFRALTSNTTGIVNVAIGNAAMRYCTTGGNNAAFGAIALQNLTTGNDNVSCGNNAGGSLTTGSRNTLIGRGAQASAVGGNDQTVVGDGLTGKGDDTAFIGGTNGAYNEKNVTTWETTSDRRIKRNIEDNNQGLEVIERIRVRNFEYRLPDEIDPALPRAAAIDKPGVQIGVIAQELQEVLPECVTANSTGVLSVSTDPLVWHLINAVKQLSARVAELEAKQ